MIWRALGRTVGLLWNLARRLASSLNADRTLLALGVTSLLAAVGVVFLPLPEDRLRPLVGWVAGPTAVVAVAGLAGLLTIWSLRGDVVEETEEPWHPDRIPERSYFDSGATAGASVDDALGLGDDLTLPPERRRSRRGTARNHVLEVAITVVTETENCSPNEARELLREGAWTDDTRAAALLAHGNSVHVPLRTRVRDWVRGETFDRRVEHAVRELESYPERANARVGHRERGPGERDEFDAAVDDLLNGGREGDDRYGADRERAERVSLAPEGPAGEEIDDEREAGSEQADDENSDRARTDAEETDDEMAEHENPESEITENRNADRGNADIDSRNVDADRENDDSEEVEYGRAR